jgi:hypothetical protein
VLTSVEFFALLSCRVKFCGTSDGVRTSDSSVISAGVGAAGTAVPARPVHPAAKMTEQTIIAMIKYREQLIFNDHPEWYKKYFHPLPAVLPP